MHHMSGNIEELGSSNYDASNMLVIQGQSSFEAHLPLVVDKFTSSGLLQVVTSSPLANSCSVLGQ